MTNTNRCNFKVYIHKQRMDAIHVVMLLYPAVQSVFYFAKSFYLHQWMLMQFAMYKWEGRNGSTHLCSRVSCPHLHHLITPSCVSPFHLRLPSLLPALSCISLPLYQLSPIHVYQYFTCLAPLSV